jgi:hypothetical protein
MFEETKVKRPVGRPKGSVGRLTTVARELMVKTNFDPLEALLRIAKNRRTPLELRIKAAAAAVPFLYPKLSTTFIHSRREADISITQVQQMAFENPLVAEAMERISLAISQAPSKRQILPPSDDTRVVDVTAESTPLNTPETLLQP